MKNVTNFLTKLDNTFTPEGMQLIINFFITFSRFECALKESNFCYKRGDYVNPNWNKFVNSIKDDFKINENNEVKTATEYLLKNPPKVQNKINGKLIWQTRIFPNSDLDINKLSKSINGVRNNLFHGGKFNGDFKADDSRNYELLYNSLIILNEWLNLNQIVKSNFLKDIS